MRQKKPDSERHASMKRIAADLGWKFHSGKLYRTEEGKIKQVPASELNVILHSYGFRGKGAVPSSA